VQSIRVPARAQALLSGAASVAMVFTACDKDAVNPDIDAVNSVVVAPATASVQVGSSVALTADVLDANGEVIPSLRVSWASEDSSIAQVSQSGIVTGLKVGTVLIAASSRGYDAVATITVNPALAVLPRVSRIVIAPTNVRIDEGTTIRLTATLLDENGGVITGMTIVWNSSNTDRATVDQTGLVRAIDDGNVTITASAGGKTGSTTIRVDDD
jgi:uncharacterized protein YjdB